MAYSIAEQAYADLFLIFRYGAATHGEIEAERYDEALHQTFALLAQFPNIVPARTDYSPPLHLYPHQSHLILYRQDGEDIVILRIFHSRQHWQRFM